ncbi:MAG: Pyr redox 2 protein [Patescibacteria group bacterium]|nr:FAD-dependent oxidoreductase [Candidatus Saccharibacteria bacterium]MDQ5963069.1 Pyr redox 2 protein [Patescibacteria group bacterium]
MNKRVGPKRKVLIVGGGFGGVKAALALCDRKDIELTLISERSDFFYFPTMYHTATGGSSEHSVINLGEIFQGKTIKLYLAKAVSIDREDQIVTCENGEEFTYDNVIFSLGVITNYFGIPGLKEHSYGIKSIEGVEQLKRHLHAKLIAENRPDLNYIIVGGGPTGIELAGSLSSYLHEIIRKHGIKNRVPHIDLVEAMPSLMPRLPKRVGRVIARRLRRLGVKLYLNSRVEGLTAEELTVSGKPLRNHTVIWTAGVANNPFFETNGFVMSPRRKVEVDEFLRSEKNIYVIADNAETTYSGMAQTAIHDGEFVAHNIICELEDRPKLAYRPKEPIYITPVGPRWASVLWGKKHFSGIAGYWLRGLADLRGFLDIHDPLDAAEQWSREFDREDLCPVCGEKE